MAELTTDDVVASLTFAPGDLVREKPSRTVGPPALGMVVAVDPLADRAQALVVWGAGRGKRVLSQHGFWELVHWEPALTTEQALYAALERKNHEEVLRTGWTGPGKTTR